MAGSAKPPKRFLDLLASPWTLLPALAGASALIGGWALDRADTLRYGYIAAGLGGAVAVAILLTRWLLTSSDPVDPAVAALRQQVLDSAQGTLSAPPRGRPQEARASGTPAALDRG